MIRRHADRDRGLADLALGADEPLRERWLGEQERTRDLGRLQAADEPERERDLRLRRERRVAAREDEAQPLVGDRARVHLLSRAPRKLLEPAEQLGLPLEIALAADAVDRAVAGRGHDPGTGIGGGAGPRAPPPWPRGGGPQP